MPDTWFLVHLIELRPIGRPPDSLRARDFRAQALLAMLANLMGAALAFPHMPHTPNFRFKSWLYLRLPVFSTHEGLELARELCARFPKISPGLVKRAKDQLQRVANEAQAALEARSRQTNLLSAEDFTVLDQDMPRSCTAILMRLDANTMLPHDKYPIAGRSEVLINKLFYSDGPDYLKDTYAAQLVAMQRMAQRIEDEDLEAEINKLCGEPFLDWFRAVLPSYQEIVTTKLSRRGGPIVNLLVHRNALSRAVVTYATAIAMTVNHSDQDTVNQAVIALDPLLNQRMVTAGRGEQVSATADLTPIGSTEGAPMPA